MNKFVYNNDFDKETICEKISDIVSKLEEERSKSDEDFSAERERELLYAQMIQGIKLNTFYNKRNIFF